MNAALQLLRKDLRLLVRGRGLLAVLIGYPLVVAALVTIALQTGERRPAIAFVNLDTSNRTVRVGDQRLGVPDYEARLAREVEVVRLDPQGAAAALEDGRVSAILTLPQGFIRDLQSGIRSPEIGLQVIEEVAQKGIVPDGERRRTQHHVCRVRYDDASAP